MHANIFSPGYGSNVRAIVRDVSAGGSALGVSQPLAVGRNLLIEMVAEDGLVQLVIVGRVVSLGRLAGGFALHCSFLRELYSYELADLVLC
jgi:hypothetical protein